MQAGAATEKQGQVIGGHSVHALVCAAKTPAQMMRGMIRAREIFLPYSHHTQNAHVRSGRPVEMRYATGQIRDKVTPACDAKSSCRSKLRPTTKLP